MLVVKAIDRDGHLTVIDFPKFDAMDSCELELPIKCDTCTKQAIEEDGLPEGSVVSRYPDLIKIEYC